MGWVSFKKRGHIVRNEHGTMVAKIAANVMVTMLERYGDDFAMSADRTKYVFKCDADFSVGNSELVKVYLWKGYTIECASTEM